MELPHEAQPAQLIAGYPSLDVVGRTGQRRCRVPIRSAGATAYDPFEPATLQTIFSPTLFCSQTDPQLWRFPIEFLAGPPTSRKEIARLQRASYRGAHYPSGRLNLRRPRPRVIHSGT